MSKTELRKKKYQELSMELFGLLKKQLNLRIRVSSNQLQQTHLLKQTRREIARIKTILTEKILYK
ncbi:50S ribosomal protein L29 [Sodalis sp. CWE]|uniref:50S ribosomal protein L29 n=1 Tax=Sodalis sp. CWE TaxID=2803816 RepID=UPI001C7CC345|nr:50S ribosomal protein L29 [Sodalis sp. CWE]MBX4180748.1 50S ribosomal protein L29 [Sodalis sp. CWE]